jgi:hypothetical protein
MVDLSTRKFDAEFVSDLKILGYKKVDGMGHGINTYVDTKTFVCYCLKFFACQQTQHRLLFSKMFPGS